MTSFINRPWQSSTWMAALGITVAAFALVILRNQIQSPPMELPSPKADNAEYLLIAEGRSNETLSVYSRRALYPFMARSLNLVSGLPLRTTFILLDILSLFLLVYFLARIFALFKLSPWMTAAFILTPSTLDRVENGYMPDLFHAALTTLFFFLLLQKRFSFAFVVLAITYMARENTLILCLVLCAIAATRGLYRLAVGSGVVLVFGTIFGSWVVRQGHGQPNIHDLPDFLYFGLKMPHQFLKNVLGLRIWTNTLPYGDPIHKFTLPGFLRAGDVHTVALCYPDWQLPLFTLISLLTLFGTGPLIVWAARPLKLWTAQHPIGIQLAFVYGLAAFFLGTSIGDWVDRLIGYGWPLFWIAVPYILATWKTDRHDLSVKWALFFLWVTPWIPVLLGYNRHDALPISILTVLGTLIAYGIQYHLLRKHGTSLRPVEVMPEAA